MALARTRALPSQPTVASAQPTGWVRLAWREHQAALVGTATMLLFVSAWEALTRSGTVNPLFLSSPSLVVERLTRLFATGEIWPHLRASGEEVGLGFGLAILVGVPLGVLIGRVRLVRYALEPLLMAKYSTPTVAFLPLLIIWFGIGQGSKVILIFLGALFIIVMNTEAGVSHVDPRLVETVRAFGANQFQVVTKLILPAAAPFVLAGIRLGVGRVLIMLVVAEMFASTAGLGFLIARGAANYDTSLVFAVVTLLGALGVVANQGLRALEHSLTPWTATAESDH